MKKIFSFLCLFFICCSLSAQQIQETIYLRNGSVIKGNIVEQTPNGSVKIQIADGSLLVYQMSEVERITKERKQSSKKEGRHRGLDFSVDAGYHIATKGGGGSISAEIGIGKRFNKNFYWGIGTGAFIPTSDGDPSIPLTSDFKVYFPLKSTSLTLGGIIRAGYVFNTSGDITVGSGKYQTTVEVLNNIMIQIMPTLEIPLSKRVDFNLGVGYTHFVPTKGSGSSGAFSMRTGFSFHKSPIRKPKKPTRDRGMQVTLEGGKVNFGSDEYDGGTGALVFTYKFNPHINLGIGFGGDFVSSYAEDGVKSLKIRDDGNVYHNNSDLDVSISAVKIFARGSYRLTDRRFSPFVACDAGVRIYSINDLYGYDAADDNSTIEYVLGKPSSMGFFAAPAIGLSLRTTNNSYLELKAGYSFAPGISGKKGEAEYDTNSFHFIHAASCKPLKMSAPFISLGFTHTFKWGEKWGK